MMKTIKLTLIALLMLTAFTNCKKDKKDDVTPVVPVTIEGTWKGTIGVGDNNTYYFIIKKSPSNTNLLTLNNGAMQEEGNGEWALDGTNFTGYYIKNMQKYSVKATFDSKTGKLNNGTVGLNNLYTGIADWSMTKQ